MSTINTVQDPLKLATQVDIQEKEGWSAGGGVAALIIVLDAVLFISALFIGLSGLAGGGIGFMVLAVALFLLGVAGSTMLVIQAPGQAVLLEFFGNYMGTVRRTGLIAVLPFMSKKRISIKAQNFDTPVSKVNDADGNPINISTTIMWQLKDTAKAVYAVEDYGQFLHTQAEAAVRHVASQYPYDAKAAKDGAEPAITLLGSADKVNIEFQKEVGERAEAAGIDIIEVRINNLAYSVEIAQAMLQRQQAGAIISAREAIVDGAVEIVNHTANKLAANYNLTEEHRAKLVSDLLVVLVSDTKVSPVINMGGK